MRRFLAAAAAIAGLTFAAPAQADETWTSDQVGEVIWAEDLGDTSVFTYQTESGREVRMYIEGLVPNIENRRVMSGYWMIPGDALGDGLCGATLMAPDGVTTSTWGRMELRWSRRTFPSNWVATMTDCFAGPITTVRARANVGG